MLYVYSLVKGVWTYQGHPDGYFTITGAEEITGHEIAAGHAVKVLFVKVPDHVDDCRDLNGNRVLTH